MHNFIKEKLRKKTKNLDYKLRDAKNFTFEVDKESPHGYFWKPMSENRYNHKYEKA